MKKIAIIVQRYGLEINGGAELHARLLAEKLKYSGEYEVEILTTCALDSISWSRYYPEGVEIINEIKVNRFKNAEKDSVKFDEICYFINHWYKYKHTQITLRNFFQLIKKRKKYNEIFFNFKEWLEVQGPHSDDLINFIKTEKDNYDVFIFFTYLYHPTNIGIREVASKSILIPTAHDEISFYLKGYKELFSSPRFIMYNMESEKKLVESVYPITKKIKSEIAGVGFDKVVVKDMDIEIEKKYFVYIGRLEDSKGCNVLLDFFNRYVGEFDPNFELIFIGQNSQNYTESKNVRILGFVSDDIKNFYLKNAEALIIPSLYESLSMVTLEAMQMGKPVIANKNCEILKNHIQQSEAGFLYTDYEQFKNIITKIMNLDPSEKEIISKNGINYVKNNYDWDVIIRKFKKTIEFVIKK